LALAKGQGPLGKKKKLCLFFPPLGKKNKLCFFFLTLLLRSEARAPTQVFCVLFLTLLRKSKARASLRKSKASASKNDLGARLERRSKAVAQNTSLLRSFSYQGALDPWQGPRSTKKVE